MRLRQEMQLALLEDEIRLACRDYARAHREQGFVGDGGAAIRGALMRRAALYPEPLDLSKPATADRAIITLAGGADAPPR